MPVANATVTATRSQGDETMSELDCGCEHSCGRKLMMCDCADGWRKLEALVVERRGEVIAISRAATRADGTFELAGLETGSVSLWADDPKLGTGFVRSVEVGARDVTVALANGVTVVGRVVIDGDQPASGAWVTLIHGEHSRFFDVLAGAEGRFSIGPVPEAPYALVAGAAGTLPTSLFVQKVSAREVTINLSTPRVITGRVELNGSPQSGVDVQVAGTGPERHVTTLPDGTFRVDELRRGAYVLAAVHRDLRAAASVEMEAKGDPPAVVLALERAAVVSGHVRDAQGKPVEGATVSIGVGPDWAQAHTSDEGEYRIVATVGQKQGLWAMREGFARYHRAVAIAAGEQVIDVELHAEALLEGAAVDAVTRSAVPNTMVWASDGDGVVARATSNGEGGWRLTGLVPGRYQVWSRHSDYVDTQTEFSAPRTGILLALDPGLSVNGIVVDESGVGVQAEVSVVPKSGFAYRSVWAMTNGEFTVRGVAPGAYEFEATAGGRSGKQSAAVPLERGEDIRIVLAEQLTISGVVVDEQGLPLKGVSVMGTAATTSDLASSKPTGVDGKFEIATDTPGEYELAVVQGDEPPDLDNRVKARTGQTGVKVTARGSRSMKGRVVNARREPIPLFKVDQEEVESASGRFSVPLKSWVNSVRVVADGYLPVEKAVERGPKVVDLGDIVLGEGRQARLKITSKATGQPVPGAEIWVQDEWIRALRFVSAPFAVTDGEGVATLRGLPAGKFAVTVTHSSHRSARVDVEPQDTERAVALEKGTTLVVTVVDAAKRPLKGEVWTLPLDERRLIPRLDTDGAGIARFEGLSPGRYIVFFGRDFLQSPGKAHRALTLTESGEVRVELSAVLGTVSVVFELGVGPGAAVPSHIALMPSTLPAENLEALDYGLLRTAGEIGDQVAPLKYEVNDAIPGRYNAYVTVRDGERFGHYAVPVQLTGARKQTVVVPVPPPETVKFQTRPE